jgi:mono/diheme cytochrome c family protein
MLHKIVIFGLLALLISCESREEITRQQYVVEGMNLYQTNCANCHQVDGSGLKDLYPPLAKTDLWKRVKMNELACLIKLGQKDSIQVNGKFYNAYMPGNPKLQALDIAELITYMREKWSPDKTIFSLDSARFALKNCP